MASDVTYSAATMAGLLSFLSPCVLPLVPPYLTFIAGTSLEELSNERVGPARRDVMLAAVLFVAGFSTVFIALGATASIFGQLIRAYLDVLSYAAGFAIILMGLHFLGILRWTLLYREARLEVQKPVGLWGAYVMGLAFAFGWTPCIGPILAAILAVASSEETVGQGAVLLAFYSVGLGLPFLLAAWNPAPGLHPLELAGAALWVVAWVGESLADRQLKRFKARPQARGLACREGLWRWSRHPNYFFEWLAWVAFLLLALPAPSGWAALPIPLLMLYFLLRVTGIPATEAQALRSRPEDYPRYQRETSAFVPWFPREPV